MSEHLLEIRGLSTYFFMETGIAKAVNDVSFYIDKGEMLGLVGESGCGKSVTAQSILRIVDKPGKIVSGEILLNRVSPDGRIQGTNLVQLPEEGAEMYAIRGQEIALIFQEPMTSFSPVHTIGSQIVESIRLHEKITPSEARRCAIAELRRVGIPRPEQRVDSFAHQLSGGLRQRAMIAMALSCNPAFLIADEPTTALDVTTQAQILDLLRRLQQERNMAIMLITHNLGVVAELADEVVVMYLGRLAEKGPVDAIFHNPKHPYTRALLRSIPSIHSKPREILPTIAGSIPHPYNRPQGCPFHPRCPQRIPGKCESQVPALAAVGDQQVASCFLYPGA